MGIYLTGKEAVSTAIHFPSGFLWGAATSSYQIEGAVDVDGRSPSIWDRFCERPGAIEDGTDGARACDHYRRYADDVALIEELGLDSYRFSVAWPRVIPGGTGAVNDRGLDFYRRLVDRLLEKGIRPLVTLYHWDLPQVLEDRGGWPARDTAKAFVDYAAVVVGALGDRVEDWVTHNEPWCASVLGYQDGKHAPGRTNARDALAAAHHLMLSHGLAVPVVRELSAGARVGLSNIICPGQPASPSHADAEACRVFDGVFNRWYFDPLYGRGYPEDIVAFHRAQGHLPEGPMPFLRDGDLETMAAPTDFIGLNYYSRAVCRDETIPEAENEPVTVRRAPKSEDTDMGWEVYPEGLYDALMRVHRDYAPPKILLTEIGCAYDTGPDETGRVADHRRIRFLHDHLVAARRAMADGVPLEGVYMWSLLDNFEWAFGYAMRFGIVYVDFETQERFPKDSARWLRDSIAAGELQPLGAAGEVRQM
ncbi:MAG: GH1 family beta-glucosidase [Polyangiaceae bacterium]